jgi:hypothetical protein
MIIFFGLLGLLQCWFLPGLVLLLFIKRIKFFEVILLSLPLSLVINYILVFSLSIFNIYKKDLIFLIIILEIVIIIYKFYLINYYKKFYLFFKQLTSFNSKIYNFGFTFLDIIIFILFLFYIFLALNNIGEVIHPSDPLIMWNDWALEWNRGRLPVSSGDYPQSVPMLLSIIYLLTQNVEVEFFSRILFLIYPLWVFLIFFYCLFFIKKYLIEIKLSLIFFALFNFYIFRHYAMNIGYVDPILPVYTSVSGMLLCKLIKEKIYLNKYAFFIICVITSGAGIVKQTGLLVSFIFPILFFIFLEEKLKKKLIYLLVSTLIIFIIIAPWYLYKLYSYFILYSDSSNVVTLSKQVNGTILDKILRGVNYLFSWCFPFVFLLIFYAIKNRHLFIVFLLFVTPFFLIWSIFFGNDSRNFAIAIPAIGLILGFGYFNFFKHFNKYFFFKKYFKLISFSILLVLSILFLKIYRPDSVLISKSFEKKMLRGNSKINIILYHYVKKNNIINDIYYNDQEFYKLPIIENQLILESCELIDKRINNFKHDNQFYVFINKNLCQEKKFDEEKLFIKGTKIFSEDNFILYLINK